MKRLLFRLLMLAAVMLPLQAGAAMQNAGDEPIGAQAPTRATQDADYDFTYNNLKFAITGSNTAAVVGSVLDSPSGAWSIPSTVSSGGVSYRVTEIAADAFSGCTEITTVILGSNVEVIGAYAFNHCKKLATVNLKNVTTINDAAFGTCTSLTEITLPNSLTYIGDRAFDYTMLETVSIPASVSYMGSNPFYNCPNLTSINVNPSNADFASVDGVLFNKSLSQLLCYPAGRTGTSYDVPESVTELGMGAFARNDYLQSVTLPSGLQTVGYLAFVYDSALTSLTCLATTPPGIDFDAFSSTANSNLTLYVPKGYASAYQAADGWKDLPHIAELNYDFASGGIYYNIKGSNTVEVTYRDASYNSYSGSVVVPATVTNGGVTYTVTAVGNHAFYQCSNLTSLELPGTVTIFEGQSIQACPVLESLNLPEGLTYLGSYTVSSLPMLKTLYIPSTLTTVSYGALTGLSGLESITVAGGNPKYDSRGNCNALIETSTTTLLRACRNTFIPEGVTAIGDGAFANVPITRLYIPNSVTAINTNAFVNSGLESIFIPESVTTIGSWAFSSCPQLRDVNFGNHLPTLGYGTFYGCPQLTSFTCLAKTVPTLNANAIESSILNQATLYVELACESEYQNAAVWGNFSNIIVKCYDFVLDGVYYLRTGNNTVSVSFPDIDWENDPNNYSGEVTIPDNFEYEDVTYSVTAIREHALWGMTNLTAINLPETTLRSIDGAAFIGCTSLTKIDIPESVTAVGGMAFFGCTALRHVIIGANCSFVNQVNVFGNCNRINYVTCFATTPPVMDEGNFTQTVYDNAILYVPDNSLEAYQNTAPWNKFHIFQKARFDFMVDGIYYKIAYDNHVGVSSKDMSFGTYSGDVVIPAEVEYEGTTYVVDRLDHNAFAECPDLKSVKLPDTMFFIDYNAFRESGVSSIRVPDNVVSIGDGAFNTCPNLKAVTLGSGLIAMPGNVFHNTPALERVFCKATTPPSIRENTFDESHYTNTTLVVPAGCVDAYRAAEYWENFTTVKAMACDFEEGGVYYHITGSNTVEVTYLTTDYNSYVGDVNIPETVTHDDVTYIVTAIGANAFRMSKSLTSVTIPSTVTVIKSYAFHYCEGLTEVDIPNSVTTISDHAFWICMNLNEVIIPNSVTTLGQMSFRNCTALKRVVIGENVTSIGSTSFIYCPNITEVICLAATPPTLSESGTYTTFESTVYENAVLRVPYGSHEAYRNHAGWGRFATVVSEQIIEPTQVGDVNGDGLVNITDVIGMINMLSYGGDMSAAADVNDDGQKNITDVILLINILATGSGGTATVGPAKTNYLVNLVPFTMVKVDGGTFMMGLEGDDVAMPVHQVTLTDFWIGETEVTQALWQTVMGNNPSYSQSNADLPVENMEWNDCQEFVGRMSALTGKNFRLPTEAEWEYAARGGQKSLGYVYAGSNNLDEVAWYSGNSGNQTHVVATKAPNELGLYDMSGNVFEWCQDYWGEYSSAAQVNPTGPATGEYRVCRSSAYSRDNNNNWFKCGGRTCDSPQNNAYDTGLRLAM